MSKARRLIEGFKEIAAEKTIEATFRKIIMDYLKNPDKDETIREKWVERMFNRLDKELMTNEEFTQSAYDKLAKLLSKIR